MNLRSHLCARHLNLSLHKTWIDEENRRVTFPLYNLSGQIIGYQRYFPEGSKDNRNEPSSGRYYTYVKGDGAVWGLESWNLSNTLFITEGIFDAARLTERGVSALATISNDPKPLKAWFSLIRKIRPVIAICDPDDAGKRLAKYGNESYIMQNGSDLGACHDSEVDEILRKYL